MCTENRLKLIPVVIIIAAIVLALIFSFVNFAVFIPARTIYPYSLAGSLLILLLTGVFIFICGLHNACSEKFPLSCRALRCFGPVILFAATGSIILSSIGAAGLDFSTVPGFGAILNIIYAVIATLFFTTTIVYFVGMLYEILTARK